ncbi:hypothetical protein [Methylobacterium sp. GXF4]|uniref:hypothetical protein n=1 Tax=Methylobacterium sp. GXF4 TaxID=1096546 RepID=UPI000FFE9E28|nr:hypothetical protein [Methylobacterium sp. GXF4]
MSLELALASFLIKRDGIRIILENEEKFSDADIHERWLDNRLRTKRFEENKKYFKEKHRYLYEIFEGIVDNFQATRNKIVHFHFNFADADLYDLKFEVTYVLIHVVSKLIFEDDTDLLSNMSSLLSDEVFLRLVKFPPYVYNVEKLASENSRRVLGCPICHQRTFSDSELKCFACGYDDPFADLITCRECDVRAVIYDHLNIDINKSVPALCLNCGERCVAFNCAECELLSTGSDYMDCEFCKSP